MSDPLYMVAGCKPWSRQAYDEIISQYPGQWLYVGTKKELDLESVRQLKPRYIFFLHWSWIVPMEMVRDHECVCFHMADVPYGRGGSPLQNLIVRGHEATKLTALRMTEEIDAGPVYFKRDLRLEGSAQEIYFRANRIAAEMIKEIILDQPRPTPQTGTPVIFKRRKPEESLIPQTGSLDKLYDFIRMLDAEGYPRGFLEHAGFRYEFSRAKLAGGELAATVNIKPIEEKKA